MGLGSTKGWGVFIVPLREELVAQIRPALLILMAATIIVLVIACANIANLLLARSSAREKEMTVRASLGAGQARLIRQLLTESLLLSVIGCAVGLVFGEAGLMAIRGLHSDILPHVGRVELDSSMLLLTLAAAVFTGLLFGLAPALHISRPRLHDAMKEAGREGSGGRRGQRMRNALVVAEIAFSLLLVTGAGLTIRSFYQLLHVDPGFRTDHILTMSLSLPSVTYPAAAVPTFFHQLLDGIRSMPGVQSAGATSQLPLGGTRFSGSVTIENSNEAVLQHVPGFAYGYIETDMIFTTPGYFETMKTPLVSGRTFTDADTATSPHAVLVDTKFAASVWPGRNPLQERICINFTGDPKSPQPQWATVVGVVAHVHNQGLDVNGRGQAYFPQSQDPFDSSRAMFVTIRTAQDPGSVARCGPCEGIGDGPEPAGIWGPHDGRSRIDFCRTTQVEPRLAGAVCRPCLRPGGNRRLWCDRVRGQPATAGAGNPNRARRDVVGDPPNGDRAGRAARVSGRRDRARKRLLSGEVYGAHVVWHRDARSHHVCGCPRSADRSHARRDLDSRGAGYTRRADRGTAASMNEPGLMKAGAMY